MTRVEAGIAVGAIVEYPFLNGEVQSANSQLQTANSQLQTANQKISTLNSQLQTDTAQISSLQAQVAESSAFISLNINNHSSSRLLRPSSPRTQMGRGQKRQGSSTSSTNSSRLDYGRERQHVHEGSIHPTGNEWPDHRWRHYVSWWDPLGPIGWWAASPVLDGYEGVLAVGLLALQAYANSAYGSDFES